MTKHESLPTVCHLTVYVNICWCCLAVQTGGSNAIKEGMRLFVL
jgi:hypothetical protein